MLIVGTAQASGGWSADIARPALYFQFGGHHEKPAE
jgi:hypothetical protein